MPYTSGFFDEYELEDHWQDHGADFNAKSRDEYLQQADTFLGCPKTGRIFEQKRPSDDENCEEVVRFNNTTKEFGVLVRKTDPDTKEIVLFILTYFRPNPRQGTALDYYRRECLRRK